MSQSSREHRSLIFFRVHKCRENVNKRFGGKFTPEILLFWNDNRERWWREFWFAEDYTYEKCSFHVEWPNFAALDRKSCWNKFPRCTVKFLNESKLEGFIEEKAEKTERCYVCIFKRYVYSMFSGVIFIFAEIRIWGSISFYFFSSNGIVS